MILQVKAMTLPNAEEVLKGFSTGKSEETPQEYLASLMKEYTRQVLDCVIEVDNTPENSKVTHVKVSSILKIKEEL
jgi:hypothetical protein